MEEKDISEKHNNDKDDKFDDEKVKPWLEPGADITDYFNYGFNEDTWKCYNKRQQRMRWTQISINSHALTPNTSAVPVLTNNNRQYPVPTDIFSSRPHRKMNESINVICSDVPPAIKEKVLVKTDDNYYKNEPTQDCQWTNCNPTGSGILRVGQMYINDSAPHMRVTTKENNAFPGTSSESSRTLEYDWTADHSVAKFNPSVPPRPFPAAQSRKRTLSLVKGDIITVITGDQREYGRFVRNLNNEPAGSSKPKKRTLTKVMTAGRREYVTPVKKGTASELGASSKQFYDPHDDANDNEEGLPPGTE